MSSLLEDFVGKNLKKFWKKKFQVSDDNKHFVLWEETSVTFSFNRITISITEYINLQQTNKRWWFEEKRNKMTIWTIKESKREITSLR